MVSGAACVLAACTLGVHQAGGPGRPAGQGEPGAFGCSSLSLAPGRCQPSGCGAIQMGPFPSPPLCPALGLSSEGRRGGGDCPAGPLLPTLLLKAGRLLLGEAFLWPCTHTAVCVAEAPVHHPGAGPVLAMPQFGRRALHRYAETGRSTRPGAREEERLSGDLPGTCLWRGDRRKPWGRTAETYKKYIFIFREEAGHLVHRGPQVRREADDSLNRGLGWSVPVKSPALHRPYP